MDGAYDGIVVGISVGLVVGDTERMMIVCEVCFIVIRS